MNLLEIQLFMLCTFPEHNRDAHYAESSEYGINSWKLWQTTAAC